MGINIINVLKRMNLRKGKKIRTFLANAITVARWGTSLQAAGNMKLIKTKSPRSVRRKKTWR